MAEFFMALHFALVLTSAAKAVLLTHANRSAEALRHPKAALPKARVTRRRAPPKSDLLTPQILQNFTRGIRAGAAG